MTADIKPASDAELIREMRALHMLGPYEGYAATRIMVCLKTAADRLEAERARAEKAEAERDAIAARHEKALVIGSEQRERASAAESEVKRLKEALERLGTANERSTNSRTAIAAFSWVRAVAHTALTGGDHGQ